MPRGHGALQRRKKAKKAAAERSRHRTALSQLREGRFYDAFRTVVFFKLAALSRRYLGRNIFKRWFDNHGKGES